MRLGLCHSVDKQVRAMPDWRSPLDIFMITRQRLCVHIAMFAAALIPLTPTASAQGQELLKQPASVPIELATALASAGGFGNDGDPQILIDALPEWIATRLFVPSGARVLGSAFIGSTMVGVVNVPTASDTVLKDFERELQKRGWKTPPAMPSMGGGFRPASTGASAQLARRFTLCGDRQILIGWIGRQRAASTTVLLRVSSAGGVGQCNPPQYPSEMTRPRFPTLYNPQGAVDARMGGDCPTGTMSNMSTSTSLKTPMSASAVMDHYGQQLQDSGWTGAGIALETVTRTWTRPDSTGALAQITLTVSSSPGDSTCRMVNLDARTPSRRP